jgi:hypothetical protein
MRLAVGSLGFVLLVLFFDISVSSQTVGKAEGCSHVGVKLFCQLGKTSHKIRIPDISVIRKPMADRLGW